MLDFLKDCLAVFIGVQLIKLTVFSITCYPLNRDFKYLWTVSGWGLVIGSWIVVVM